MYGARVYTCHVLQLVAAGPVCNPAPDAHVGILFFSLPPPLRLPNRQTHSAPALLCCCQCCCGVAAQIPCIFATPGVYTAEGPDNYRVWEGLFWLPQVVGASFFIASALLFMLEEQPTWYRLQPQRIGWHVGFWNLVGALGFWLSGFFGFWSEPQGVLQVGGTAASTFWGAWAFLIGSYLQLLEAINTRWDRCGCW